MTTGCQNYIALFVNYVGGEKKVAFGTKSIFLIEHGFKIVLIVTSETKSQDFAKYFLITDVPLSVII